MSELLLAWGQLCVCAVREVRLWLCFSIQASASSPIPSCPFLGRACSINQNPNRKSMSMAQHAARSTRMARLIP
eukprot:3964317-Amphidinium_carterae.1